LQSQLGFCIGLPAVFNFVNDSFQQDLFIFNLKLQVLQLLSFLSDGPAPYAIYRV
jgi:hypothetical protein